MIDQGWHGQTKGLASTRVCVCVLTCYPRGRPRWKSFFPTTCCHPENLSLSLYDNSFSRLFMFLSPAVSSFVLCWSCLDLLFWFWRTLILSHFIPPTALHPQVRVTRSVLLRSILSWVGKRVCVCVRVRVEWHFWTVYPTQTFRAG